MRSDRYDDRVTRQVGAALLRIRERRGRKQCVVADLAGITHSMLSAYEGGRMCPAVPTLVKVLRALDCSAEEFGRVLGPWGCLPG
ncbi:MAG: helix-turn-helix transcriptional regulator [Acidobacteriota bacterium]|nr:helix-turn-helix transcriptional regulator [Acidobacteriota bacterium]